jgi:hypothetical protein
VYDGVYQISYAGAVVRSGSMLSAVMAGAMESKSRLVGICGGSGRSGGRQGCAVLRKRSEVE